MKTAKVLAGLGIVLFGLAQASAQTSEYPKRKPGAWEVQMESAQMGGKGMTMVQCIDEKTDAEMQKRAMQGEGKANCSVNTVKKTASGWEMDSVCKQEATTITTHGVVAGDFQSAYQVDLQSKFNPPMHGMAQTQMRMKVRYMGACKDGLKPGDVSMNGMVVGNPAAGKPMAPGDMKNMKPEDMKKMIEQMKKQMGQQQ